jgi:gliding motility-associated-like protein
MGIGSPNPIFANIGSVPSKTVGYCQEATSVAVYKNEGTEVDAGFGTMYDIIASIGIGASFETKIKGYKVNSIKIAGKDITLGAKSIIDFGKDPIFETDPDGNGGLTDSDNDGYFDDLPIGQSFEMILKYEFLCAENDTTKLCTNERNVGVSATIRYRSACGETLDKINENFQNVSNNNNGFEDVSDTDAFIGTQDTFYVTHTEERSMFFFEKDCGGNEKLYAKIYLPKGIKPAINKFGLYKNGNTSPLLMVSDTIKNDTLYLSFDGTDPFLSGKYELRMAFYATCDADLGIVKLPFEFGFYCPSCTCWSPWYCNTINGPKLHGTSVCKLAPCPVGLRTTAFEANRTTLGYTDATFKTKVNPNNVNRKVAISCDSVEIKVKAVVGSTPINDSIGVVINYSSIIDKSVGAASLGEILKFGNGRVRIFKGSQIQNCVVAANAAKFTPGFDKSLRIDLNACLAQGITLNPGDSLEFVGNFTVDPDGPYATQFKNIPNFRGYLFSKNNGVDYSCDDFGENFIISKNRTIFDFPTNSSFPKGCATANMDYRLITINNGFKDYFPKEYRKAARPDSVYLSFDPAMLTAFEDLAIEYSIPGHPVFGNNNIPLANLKNYPDGKFRTSFDTLQYRVAALNNVTNYSFLLRVKATPNCKSLTGSKDGTNRFDFNATFRYTDRFYAAEIGDGKCAIDSTVAVDNDIYYTEPAELAFNPVSNPNFDLLGDTATWTVKLCNKSIYSDAGTSWIAIENPNDKLEVVSIQEILPNGSFNNLPVKKFGSGNKNAFAISKALLASNGSNDVKDVCATLKIKALVKSCGSLKITAVAGWDCKPKPNTWNPQDNPPCQDYRMDLRVVAQEPAIDAVLDEGFNKNPDLCDTVYLDLLVRNTGKAKAYNVNTKIWIPAQGATLVPGSVQIAYPSGAAFKTLSVNPTKKGISSKGLLYEYENFKNLNDFLDKNGLVGFNQISPTDSNEFKIRYKVVTDCEFKSGALSYFAVQGEKACGEKTNLETGESKPIRIKGAILANDQRIFDIKITKNTIIVPTLVSTIELAVMNTTAFLSDTTDKMSIKLPAGILYKAGTTKGILPSGYDPGEPKIEIENGQQVLTYPIAVGLGLADSCVIRFLTTSPNFDCDNPPLFEANIETIVTRAIKCLSNPNAEPCIIDVITSTGGGTIVELPVRNTGALAVNFTKVTSICGDNNTEIVTAIGNIQNLDTIQFPDLPIEITYFHDADGNGKLDSSENILKVFVMNGPLDTMAIQAFKHEFSVSSKEICLIRAKINAQGASCLQYTYAMPAPALKNAGPDKGLCIFEGDDVTGQIGDKECNNSDYSYKWTALKGLDANQLLSDVDVATPNLKFQWDANLPDTIYFVLETNRGTNCDATKDTAFIFRNNANAPTAKISISPDKLCAGSNATLTGSGGVQYAWTDASGTTLGDKNTLIISPKQTTTYTLKVTDAGGCKDTAKITVTPLPAPVVTASADATICLLNMVTLNAKVSGGTSFIYSWTPTIGLNNPTVQNPVAKPGETTVYTVTAIDANGCKGSDDVRVQVDTCAKCIPPMIDVTQIKKPVCGLAAQTGSIQLYLWGGGHKNYDFSWTPDLGTTDDYGAAKFNLPSGIYSVKINPKKDTACSKVFKFAVTAACVGEATINITNTVNTNCLSSNNGAVNFNVVYGADFKGPADTVITDGIKEYQNGHLPAGDYYLAIHGKMGCLAAAVPFTIKATNNDAIQILSTVVDRCDSIKQKGSIKILAAGGSGTYTYDWADLPGTNDIKDRIDVKEGIYSLRVFDTNGCYFTNDSIKVNRCKGDKDPSGGGSGTPITPSIASGATTDNLKCFGDKTGKVNFTITGDSALVLTSKTYITKTGVDFYENGKLEAGDYLLILTDDKGKPYDTLSFTINQPNAIVIGVKTEKVCNGKNGSIVLTISGGNAPFTYDWADLTGTNDPKDRTNLNVGTYQVTVKDSLGCSSTLGSLLIENCDTVPVSGGNPKFDASFSVTNPKCAGEETGFIKFAIKGDSILVASSKNYITRDGIDRHDNGKLAAGNYLLILTDKNDKPLDTILFSIDNPAPLFATHSKTDVCKGVKGSITLTVGGGTQPYNYDWADITGNNDSKDRTDLEIGKYSVTITDNNGCFTTIKDIEIIECKDTTGGNGSLCNPFQLDSMKVYIGDCDDIAQICLPMSNPDSFNIFVNGNKIITTTCNGNYFSYASLPTASSFILTDWNGFSGTFKNFTHLADSLAIWDFGGNWTNDIGAKQITGGSSNAVYPDLNLQFLVNGVPMTYALSFISGKPGISISLPKGMNKVYAEHISLPNCNDSIFVNVDCNVPKPKPDTQYVTIFISETGKACIDVSELKGTVVNIKQGCSKIYIADTKMIANNCIEFKGVNLGKDTMCFTACDQYGICDVTYVIVDVNKPFKDVYDSLYVGEFKTYCINYQDYGFEGAVKVTSTCDAKLKKNISFQFDPNSPKCVEFGGVKVGYDTVCLRVCEIATNRCSDFRLIVKVLPSKLKLILRDTVYKDSSATYCFKTTSFQTKPKTFVNKCPNSSGNDVLFTLNNNTFCITYKGLKVGVDTACIELCDSLGNCINIDVQVWVKVFTDPPVAVDDIDTTLINRVLVIDEMKNDKINGKLMEMELVSKPRLGNVTMTTDMKIQYIAADEVNCTKIDSFLYRICNQDGCDTAMIKIYIRCPKVKVYNGFSPNDDGSNETFTITDIDFFPNNQVTIYNRWGNEIFFKKGYNNEWKGTWNGKELPDGTYFYVIELNDDDHTMLSGYLQIHR